LALAKQPPERLLPQSRKTLSGIRSITAKQEPTLG
jgi:hypothetical protein